METIKLEAAYSNDRDELHIELTKWERGYDTVITGHDVNGVGFKLVITPWERHELLVALLKMITDEYEQS